MRGDEVTKLDAESDQFETESKQCRDVSGVEISISVAIAGLSIFITMLFMSTQIIQPLLYDASLIRTGRYAMSSDAWDTIAEDEALSIVGIGSSMMQYSLNGTCIEEEMEIENSYVYNLAIPGGMPYMEMVQTETAINAAPDLILLEVAPGGLWDIDQHSTDGMMDYFQLRLTISSLLFNSDKGEWIDILRPSESKYFDIGFEGAFNSERAYSIVASEEFLNRVIMNESSAPTERSAAYVPSPGSDLWHDYLRTPKWLYSKLELMDPDSRSDWENNTLTNTVKKGVNNPLTNGTLNHLALDYMVSRFTESGIKVILVAPPLHPLLLEQLEHEQFAGHNNTLNSLSERYDVLVMNLIWDEYWVDDDFYNQNHLDRHGRETFCQYSSPIIKEYLGA